MKKFDQSEEKILCKTISWLNAVSIKNKLDGNKLNIQTKSGTTLTVQPSSIVQITSPDTKIALEAFHSVSDAAGYGKPVPVNRGVVPVSKLRNSNDFDLIVMRHRDFRRVPNPPEIELLKYKKVFSYCCRKFFYLNKDLCSKTGVSREDLFSYCFVWGCNYLGLFQVLDETENDNVKKMTCYIRQRFIKFREALLKKEREIVPDQDVVDGVFGFRRYSENPYEVESSVPRTLKQYLDLLPHDEMVQVLTDAHNNSDLNYEIRFEAERQLKKHQKKCKKCLEIKK